jgi:hypothetical protein
VNEYDLQDQLFPGSFGRGALRKRLKAKSEAAHAALDQVFPDRFQDQVARVKEIAGGVGEKRGRS